MVNISSTPASVNESSGLKTSEEIAKFLNVDPHTVRDWAKTGKIATAFREGRVIRFSLDDVLASLNVNSAGEGRGVELTVLALSLTFGPDFPRIPRFNLDYMTAAELTELYKRCAAYAADLEHLKTPQEVAHYAEGVLEAARLEARGGLAD